MKPAKAFVELDKKLHDRESFDCGEAELNQFIQHFAARHMDAGVSKTLVLPTQEHLGNGKLAICAFYAVTATTISRDSLPQKLAKKLPAYPVPVFLIAQLAVDLSYRGMGLGKVTLIKAMQYLWEVNASLRAFAIVVDCLNPAAEHFYSKYDFEVLCLYHGKTRMYIPMATVAQLFS